MGNKLTPTEVEDEGAKIQEYINVILKQRGFNYGKFSNHAQLAQNLKNSFYSHMEVYNPNSVLSSVQREAIDMIFHKLARIGNGDPHFIDSWIDILGYTQLVINEMREAQS